MKRIILFLLIIGMVVAQPKPVAIQERINPPIEIISDAYFASTISSHGLEKAVYNITITNKEEDSMDVKLKFRFSSTPEKLFLSQNNQEIGLELTSESPNPGHYII